MHLIVLREIIRDAEVASAIAPVIRQHLLSVEDTAAALTSLGVPRAPGVARIASIIVPSYLPGN